MHPSMNSNSIKRIKIAIIGTGPSAMYTAQHILKFTPPEYKIAIDFIDKSPVPFGLIRYGVSPDHQSVKNVIHKFQETLSHCAFYGNITVGTDISIFQLQKSYHGVVIATGAFQDKHLNIPQFNAKNCFSSSEFVGWYNGLPQHANLKPLLNHKTAIVIGHGNVAIDIARILTTPIHVLEKTDITKHALDILCKSKIENVYVVGRRGPMQASFTTKEIRDLIKSPHIDLKTDLNLISKILEKNANIINRTQKRKLQVLLESSPVSKLSAHSVNLNFLKSPVGINLNLQGEIESITFEENTLSEVFQAIPTGKFETIDCGLMVKSIGYQISEFDGLPTVQIHDSKKIQHDQGRVIIDATKEPRFEHESGIYVVGWAKRGSYGDIASNLPDAIETGDSVLQDLDKLKSPTNSLDDFIHGLRYVDYNGWTLIDSHEKLQGKLVDKPREKVTAIPEMISIAYKSTS